jgi:hypothetical protein
MFPGKPPEPGKLYSFKRALLLCLVVLGLLVGLATRYSGTAESPGTATAASASSNAKHQHLDSDAIQWTPSISDFGFFVSSVCSRHVVPSTEPLRTIHLADPLYNRPPPSSC